MGTPTYELIASIDFTNAGNSSYTPTFSNIPNTFKHLEIVVTGYQGVNYYSGMIFNGDSGLNYSYMNVNQTPADNNYGTGGVGEAQLKSQNYGNVSVGTQMGAIRYTFFNYANTTTTKGVAFDWGSNGFGSGLSYGFWNSTAAINQITLYPGYVWNKGRIDLYGLAG